MVDDPQTGLVAVIAVHSAALGPAAGGCRFWRYPDKDRMIADAARLAKGMSYKNALAGLPFGGGKAVIQRPDGEFDRAALFAAFGDAVAALGGAYITAEDVGTSIADMQAIRSRTRFVAGLESAAGIAGGDPSPWTALGIFEGMMAAAGMRGISLCGATVAVQGVGNVGGRLCRLLAEEGAALIVADIDEVRAATVARELGGRQVGIDEILEAEAEILAPCALGGALNDRTIPRLRAEVICGGANNQLEQERHGELLRERGCLYAPDYVVNAGGIINVSAEYLGESCREVEGRVRQIAPRLLQILRRAEETGLPSNRVADDLAQEVIAVRGKQSA
jgi:leucine dehydrogenase